MSDTLLRFYVGCDAVPSKVTVFTTLDSLADQYGGATVIFSQGSWKNDAGKILTEPGIIFELMVNSAEAGELTLTIGRRLKDIFQQECVLVLSHLVISTFVS